VGAIGRPTALGFPCPFGSRQSASQGHAALTPGFQCDRLCTEYDRLRIEVSDKARSYQTFGHIKTSGPRGCRLSCELSDQVWSLKK
jgi:hypothetical protein